MKNKIVPVPRLLVYKSFHKGPSKNPEERKGDSAIHGKSHDSTEKEQKNRHRHSFMTSFLNPDLLCLPIRLYLVYSVYHRHLIFFLGRGPHLYGMLIEKRPYQIHRNWE